MNLSFLMVIIEDRKGIAEEIRKAVAIQKDLWQKIPWLALEADGRIGFSSKYACAYERGYLQLEASKINGRYRVYLDLDTGELFDAFFIACGINVLASDENVVNLLRNGYELNATETIKNLEQEAKKLQILFLKNPKGWREEKRRKFGIEKIFTRKD